MEKLKFSFKVMNSVITFITSTSKDSLKNTLKMKDATQV
jgi:hypothetical protein